jgi:hypothetical protein
MKLLTTRDAYKLEKAIEDGKMTKEDMLDILAYAQDATCKIIEVQNRLEKAKQIIEQLQKDLEI